MQERQKRTFQSAWSAFQKHFFPNEPNRPDLFFRENQCNPWLSFRRFQASYWRPLASFGRDLASFGAVMASFWTHLESPKHPENPLLRPITVIYLGNAGVSPAFLSLALRFLCSSALSCLAEQSQFSRPGGGGFRRPRFGIGRLRICGRGAGGGLRGGRDRRRGGTGP